jgi:signal transduction histidine kinase
MPETNPYSTTDTSRQAQPDQILLVEDNPSDARLIEAYVEESSWTDTDGTPTIRHVDRLASAVDSRDDDVDAVLLDLDLPDSTGFDTLDTMLDAVGAEPVVVLTGLDDQQVGEEAVERGAQDYLVKGDLTPDLLGRTLRYAVQRERHQQELERRNEELTLLNRIVRHDIKNDAALVMGWGEALERHVDPAGEEHLDRVISAGEHITSITETVGDFLTILEGDEELDVQPLDLESLLRTEVEKAQTAHPDATITLRVDGPPSLRVAGTELLSSVFRNLLNNAVIHNDTGRPRVLVDVAARDDTVEVRVIDNGPGVPDSQKEEVFGRGEMGLGSPGSGIGLYLVDTLVDAYGGEVHIEDWEGSVFPSETPDTDGGSAETGVGTEDDGAETGVGAENGGAETAVGSTGDESGSVFVVTLRRP